MTNINRQPRTHQKTTLRATLYLLTLFVCLPLQALEFECQAPGDTRYIRLELPGKNHLCEVTVTKSQQKPEVKWYANKDSQFCSEKTLELKNKYATKWGFSCSKWPDRDGVAALSARHREILDAELKKLIDEGREGENRFRVRSVKAVASTTHSQSSSTLVLQFFSEKPSGKKIDKTILIVDDGKAWETAASIDSLAEFVDIEPGYRVKTALINSIGLSGELEVATFVKSRTKKAGAQACYGSQVLTASSKVALVARSPHRFVCTDENDASKQDDAG